MPIKGLSRQAPSFPEIGILRKGGPKRKKVGRDGKEIEVYGADLKYFRFTSDDGDAVAAFYAEHPKEPRQIEVVLPYATTDENWSDWKEHWVAGGLKHRCDGETCVIWQKPDGTYSQEPKPCPGGCAPVGRLKVILPRLRRLAYVTVLTGSILDIINLGGQLRALEVIRGDLRGIPMILSRRPRKISTPDDKTKRRVRREKWLLSIEAAPQWVGLQLEAQQIEALPQLPPGYINGEEDDELVVDAITGEILSAPITDGPEWTAELVEENEQEPESEAEPEPEAQTKRAPVKSSGWTADDTRRATERLLTKVQISTAHYQRTSDMFKTMRELHGADFAWGDPNDASLWDTYAAELVLRVQDEGG